MGNSIIEAQIEFKEQSGSDELPNTQPFTWVDEAEKEIERLYKQHKKLLDKQWELYLLYHVPNNKHLTTKS